MKKYLLFLIILWLASYNVIAQTKSVFMDDMSKQSHEQFEDDRDKESHEQFKDERDKVKTEDENGDNNKNNGNKQFKFRNENYFLRTSKDSAYYANVVKKHGWWIGVGKRLTKSEASHLRLYYKTLYHPYLTSLQIYILNI